jgi:predicted acetyltransferase
MLDVLATQPEFMRQGARRLLVDFVLRIADEMGLPVYLESSPYSYRLHQASGFEDVGVDLARYTDGGMG